MLVDYDKGTLPNVGVLRSDRDVLLRRGHTIEGVSAHISGPGGQVTEGTC
jgi:hypothetical protein